jgi:hemerythrin
MRRMEWNQEWEMGEPHLDRQHRAMIGALNRLVDAIAAGRPQPEVKKAISFLLLYVGTHLQMEEAVMEQWAFPELEAHRQQHQACTRQIDQLLEHHRSGAADTLPELVQFFTCWLEEHLLGADQRLANYLKERVVA